MKMHLPLFDADQRTESLEGIPSFGQRRFSYEKSSQTFLYNLIDLPKSLSRLVESVDLPNISTIPGNRACTWKMGNIVTRILLLALFFSLSTTSFSQVKKLPKTSGTSASFKLSVADYNDRVYAIWRGQILATVAALPAEHNVAAVKWVDSIAQRHLTMLLDDDWYYEMIAVKGFEKYGVGMTSAQLGDMWLEHQCGSWGSSAEARKLLEAGVKAPHTGHPLRNKFWFTIGPQFSADVYGALAPGMPNEAARMARLYGHINGYAEGVDGAVFVATAVSLGFVEKDPKNIVRKAASVIDKASPYRQCLDLVISMAEGGATAQQVLEAVEDKWHIQYPATNNAVANGGIIAASLWFGKSDFLTTLNLAARSLDFTDADCNAASAIAVLMAMQGSAGLPKGLHAQLSERIYATKMGPVEFKKPVDETTAELAKRTAKVGEAVLIKKGASLANGVYTIPQSIIIPQPLEAFSLPQYATAWNRDWSMVGAGFAGPKGGTWLESDSNVLITYPRDEVRRLHLHRTLKVTGQKELTVEVASDPGKAWELTVYVNDFKLGTKLIASTDSSRWQRHTIDLTPYEGETVKIRLFQNVILPTTNRVGGNAHWKNITLR